VERDPVSIPRDELREAIIRVSLELGTAYGEEGLTIRGIAAKLGISVTVLYQHFDSKADILREIRLQGLQRLIQSTLVAFELEDLRTSIVETSRAYVAFAREQPWLYRLLFEGDGLPADMLPDDQRQLIIRGQSSIRERAFAKYRGIVPDGPRLARLFARWLSALHGLSSLVVHRTLTPDHPLLPVPDLDAFVDDYLEFLADNLIRAA
jgi:AcrR family transcriptional regulator